MKNSLIKNIKAKVILDSRQKPTIGVEILTDEGRVFSSVPSGASTGKNEALALPAGQAADNINKVISPKLIGFEVTDQEKIDNFLIKLDGTKNKSCLGANAIYGLSMAACRAAALSLAIPLYRHINQLLLSAAKKSWLSVRPGKPTLPVLAFNIINGGAHAQNKLDIQEFMIVPQEKTLAANLQSGQRIYYRLKQNLLKAYGSRAVKLGDEGGFSPPLDSTGQAIEAIIKAVADVKKAEKTKLALDCAASQFFKNGFYFLEGKKMTADSLIDFYKQLVKQYRLLSLEDPFEENDFSAWSKITGALGRKILIIGDDLLTTNPQLIKKARQLSACNAMILKVNQIGTVSEALQAVLLARSFDWSIMVSHRSGETKDDFIADLAVGLGAEYIKSGAPFPEERMTKYNRLAAIEKELYEKKQ